METNFGLNNIISKSEQFFNTIIDYSPKLVAGITILIAGFWIVKSILKFYDKKIEKTNVSKDVIPFIRTIINISLKVLVIITAAEIIGIKTSSFIAIIAAVGFAVGMGLQGSLANITSGLMILIFKPFKIDDIVEIHEQFGTVEEIGIFNTSIITFDNKTVIIPNRTAIEGIITNLSMKPFLRVDLNINIPYSEKLEIVTPILVEALKKTPKVLQTPEPFVGIEKFDTHHITLSIRPFCKPIDYWDVYYNAHKNTIKALATNNIKVAYIEGMQLGEIIQ